MERAAEKEKKAREKEEKKKERAEEKEKKEREKEEKKKALMKKVGAMKSMKKMAMKSMKSGCKREEGRRRGVSATAGGRGGADGSNVEPNKFHPKQPAPASPNAGAERYADADPSSSTGFPSGANATGHVTSQDGNANVGGPVVLVVVTHMLTISVEILVAMSVVPVVHPPQGSRRAHCFCRIGFGLTKGVDWEVKRFR